MLCLRAASIHSKEFFQLFDNLTFGMHFLMGNFHLFDTDMETALNQRIIKLI